MVKTSILSCNTKVMQNTGLEHKLEEVQNSPTLSRYNISSSMLDKCNSEKGKDFLVDVRGL